MTINVETQTISQPDKENDSLNRLSELYGLLANPEEPILGETDENVLALNFLTFIKNPQNTAILLKQAEEIVGFTIAVPIEKFNPSLEIQPEGEKTAYIYATVIDEPHQNQGLVGPLTNALLEQLLASGYRFVKRDCLIKDGYAKKVMDHYHKSNSIIEFYEHEKWPEIGPEMHFKIDIEKYLQWLNKLSEGGGGGIRTRESY